MPEILRSPKVYDVCIIGSGAAGGTAAKVLTEGGIEVVLLEAGPNIDPDKDYKEHVWPYDLAHRGAGIGGAGYEDFGQTEFMAPYGAWTIEGEPYTSAPRTTFRWFRSRVVGGRTNHYGRISLRFAEVDFKGRSTDGVGDDWPITYQDLAPTTTKSRAISEFSEPRRESPALRMAFSSPHPSRVVRNSW
ncbi:MAG: FAD-dependent monooxygenase [Terriglobia bacterium]|jgi:choline dehydrogenase-like flavoprotein